MSNRKPVVVRATKIPYPDRDTAHEILPHADYRDLGWGSEDNDDAPVGSFVMYGASLTDDEIERFRGESNCLSVEDDVVAEAMNIPEPEAIDWVEMTGARGLGYDGSDVFVAVLDGGISPQVREKMGWNVVETRNFTTTETGPDGYTTAHGCMVAPVCAPPGAKVLDYIIANDAGNSMSSAFAAAVRAAANHAAGRPLVINYSYGGSNASNVQRDAIRFIEGKNAIITASAGNGGRENYLCAPAVLSREFPGLMHSSIAFDHRTGIKAPFSDCAPDATFCAPGARVRTLDAQGVQITASGTSFSAPFGAYIAACLATRNRYPMRVISSVLRRTARDTADTPEHEGGGKWVFDTALRELGLIDPDLPPPPPAEPPPTPPPTTTRPPKTQSCIPARVARVLAGRKAERWVNRIGAKYFGKV